MYTIKQNPYGSPALGKVHLGPSNLELWQRLWSAKRGYQFPLPPHPPKPAGGGVGLYVERPKFVFNKLSGNPEQAVNNIRTMMGYGYRAWMSADPLPGAPPGAFMVVLVDPADKDPNWFRTAGMQWYPLTPLKGAAGFGADLVATYAPEQAATAPPQDNAYVPPQEISPPSAAMATMATIYTIASPISAAVCAYHGYKRNDSVGWAIGWLLLGGMFPIITPVIALAQGFGEKAKP